jgi:hypothetical protein
MTFSFGQAANTQNQPGSRRRNMAISGHKSLLIGPVGKIRRTGQESVAEVHQGDDRSAAVGEVKG